MNEKRQNGQRPAGTLALSDIYFVVFRHKWKIIILSAIGLIMSLIIYIEKPVTYQSEAQLLIKYVSDSRTPGLNTAEDQRREVDSSGEGIINTEMAILGSFDLAEQVVTNAGNINAKNILAKAGGGTDTVRAADFVRDNLTIDRFPRSPVLRVIFSHPDPSLVKPMLQEIIDAYQDKHRVIHGSMGNNLDSLVEETQSLHTQLLKTEEDLRKKKADANVIDLDTALTGYGQSMALVQGQILQVSDDLALHKGILKQLQGTNDVTPEPVTNKVAEVTSNALPPIPQETIDDYNQTKDQLDSLKKQLLDMRLGTYRDTSTPVQEKKAQIAAVEKQKKQMEKDEPRLAKLKSLAPAVASGDTNSASQGLDPIAAEQGQVDLLQLKMNILTQRTEDIHGEITNLEAKASGIRDLERELKLQQDQYNTFLSKRQALKIDIDIGALKDANIVPLQDPTPPSLAFNKTPKFMIIAALGGILGGIAWAFFTEYYVDHSVKRSKEVEQDLNMRLFLSIPDTTRNGYRKLTKGLLKGPENGNGASNGAAEHVNGSNGNGANGANGLEVAAWDRNHVMYQCYEALRDRLISYFEVNNMNHKPKLVAVTGAGKGCGTTTIAAGLAASLSETGDGNVLLIDMNIEQGVAQQFFKGKPGMELNDALVNETRDPAKVQKNLYVVSGSSNGDQLSRMLPKRFANLLPTLKASDYDYIIFDMPPIARTGVTQRLAGFMDMMLLVVEAEKTNRDVVKQPGALLTESKANVSVVLNKTRKHIPAKLHQEF